MSLEQKLGGAITNARDYITGNPGNIFEYLRDRRLKNYFSNLSPQEKKEKEGLLEKYVNESIQKYDAELKGFTRKTLTRGTMLTAILNDLYSFVSKAPFSNFSAISYVLFGAKTLAESPAIYRYLKKSHDWYGALQWALMKPIDYILPVIGPAIESGLFESIVKKRVGYEAERKFLEALGKKTEKELLKEGLSNRISDVIDPVPVSPSSLPIPTYA